MEAKVEGTPVAVANFNARVSKTPGLLFEYREDTRLLGVITAVYADGIALLQHLMIWPGAPATTLARMVKAVEARLWEDGIESIELDIEHAHLYCDALAFLAWRRGYVVCEQDETTTWFKKERP